MPEPTEVIDELERDGINRSLIEEVVSRTRRFDIWLGEVDTSGGDEYYKERIEAAVRRTDTLLGMFGITRHNWVDHMTRFEDNCHAFNTPDAKGVRNMDVRGTSAARFLMNFAFQALPIESDEEGYASLALALANDGYAIEFECGGSFWTAREYIYPETGEPFWENRADPEQLALLRHEDLDVRSSVVGHSILLEGRVTAAT